MTKKIIMLETCFFLVGADGTQEGLSYDTQQEAEAELKKLAKSLKLSTARCGYQVLSRTTQITV